MRHGLALCNPYQIAMAWQTEGYGTVTQPTGGSGGYLLWPRWGPQGAFHVHLFDNCSFHVKSKGQVSQLMMAESAAQIWRSTKWTLYGGGRKTRKTRKMRSKRRRSTRHTKSRR